MKDNTTEETNTKRKESTIREKRENLSTQRKAVYIKKKYKDMRLGGYCAEDNIAYQGNFIFCVKGMGSSTKAIILQLADKV